MGLTETSNQEIFELTHKNLMYIQDFKYTVDKARLEQLINMGGIYVSGRLTELGHQPILNINVEKVLKEIVPKASAEELQELFAFWFSWASYRSRI